MYAVTVELLVQAGGPPPEPCWVRAEVGWLVAGLLAAGVEHVAAVGSDAVPRVTVFVRAADQVAAEQDVGELLRGVGRQRAGDGGRWVVSGEPQPGSCR